MKLAAYSHSAADSPKKVKIQKVSVQPDSTRHINFFAESAAELNMLLTLDS